ncbi:cytidine deaminase [Vagococcus sp. BWB3-3]|uniref:Cytidine deaminase n=1 Tax=Vagococcus allomyrinae TaxID=2794353 RepID=A0A940P3S9_9ENTE|nr:cytidine deaminase [Vagococcus allomyrinae]MBP1040927.1 cytidine deaminase [Vagococcus allomyrinae]
MTNEQRLLNAVKNELIDRYPTGWGGVAGVLLDTNDILTSISPDFPNEGSSVCMELGSMLEAANQNKNITHTICLVRHDEMSPLKILSPCGICLERLRFWGNDVMCALTSDSVLDLKFAKLSELQPHHWHKVY